MNTQVILLEEGWNRLKTGGVLKIEQILEDMADSVYQNKITTDEYSALYTCAPALRRPVAPSSCALPRPCDGSSGGDACAGVGGRRHDP